MVVLLPVKKNGLARLEAGLDMLNLDSIIRNLDADPEPLYVELPKFRLDSRVDLAYVLKELGVEGILERSADFSRLTSASHVKVDKVVQSVSMEVTEEGTEAAAATGIEFVNYNSPTTFVADHPFVFLVRDDASQAVLFMGRYTGPES